MQWKQVVIDGEAWEYEVSDSGLVRRIGSAKCLKLSDNNGYLKVVLHKNGKRKHMLVHRLVATAFIPNPNNLPEVNHKNEIRNDNRAENLEWMTRKNNINYGTGTKRSAKTRAKILSRKVIGYSLTDTRVIVLHSTAQAQKFGFNQSSISKCCRGNLKTHKGFKWKYI